MKSCWSLPASRSSSQRDITMPIRDFLRACPLFLTLALLSLRTESIATEPATNSTARPTTLLRRILVEFGGDYEDEGEGDSSPGGGVSLQTPPPAPPPSPCDYDPCRDGQVPCDELRRDSPCLCPGVTSASVAPEPPSFREVSQQDPAAILVHWCAPASEVDRYQISYYGSKTAGGGGKGDGSDNPRRTAEFGNRVRAAVLDGLEPGLTYHICVRAVNKVNSGSADSGASSACSDYELRPPNRLYLYAGLAGGAVVLLAAALSVLAFRRCRANRRTGRDAMGLANPSYSRGSVDMLSS
ncbi:LRRN4 C-terminal-like protein isoform X1 [Acipenser ruthenus]|uniref:LRRN4 C-terminal-like protein isoform X1 n=2 Tax=Acipenser ruthenus TaxID=7906 RepID=UPI002741DFF3|nr:LRRN4 C-terminal-like protein isoform X1 [Acipenser ruthenus]